MYRTFHVEQRRAFVRITDGVRVIDDEPGIQADALGWLDLGPWQAVLYCEFDGGRNKRLIIKTLGE